MNAVYREAWKQGAAARAQPAPSAKAVRRLGLSFVLSAVVLAASLLMPNAGYSTLIKTQSIAAVLSPGGMPQVRDLLDNAGSVARGALETQGGASR